MDKEKSNESSTLFVSDFPIEAEENDIKVFFKDYKVNNIYLIR